MTDPLAHPHYETPRAKQRSAFKADLAAFVDRADDFRRRLMSCRVLPAVAPDREVAG